MMTHLFQRKYWFPIVIGMACASACTEDMSDLGDLDDHEVPNDDSDSSSAETNGSSANSNESVGSNGTGGDGFGETTVVSTVGTGSGGDANPDTSVGSVGVGGGGSEETSVVSTVSTGSGVGGGSAGEAVSSVSTTGTLPEVDCSNDFCPGLCFGTSCEAEWTCHQGVACSGAEVAWCGCDGETFYAPTECPTRAFAHLGACEE